MINLGQGTTISLTAQSMGSIRRYLLEQPALLDDVRDCLHLDTLCLVDVLQRIELTGLLVLDDSDLGRRGDELAWREWAGTGYSDIPFQRHPCRRIVGGRSGKGWPLHQSLWAVGGEGDGDVDDRTQRKYERT